MKQVKLKIYKEALQEACANFDGAGQFINERIEKICNRKNLSFEEIIYFIYESFCFSVYVLLLPLFYHKYSCLI